MSEVTGMDDLAICLNELYWCLFSEDYFGIPDIDPGITPEMLDDVHWLRHEIMVYEGTV